MAIVAVPGPTVTVIVANSLAAGARAGLWNVLGTQAGLLVLIVVLAFGFEAVLQFIAPVFDVLRLIGAVYLAYLGVRLWRARGQTLQLRQEATQLSAQRYFWQGFLVLVANPKALFFFGAFIPQFIDINQPIASQVFTFGVLFMVVGGVLDSMYAFAAGKAGQWLTHKRVLWVERLSGSFLIAGGVWLLTQGHR